MNIKESAKAREQDVVSWRRWLHAHPELGCCETASTAFMPVCKANVEKYGEDWSSSPETYVCNGPYTMESWEHNSVITLVKNPNFYDADEITMETINFYLSDDANNMLSNFKNGDWELIDDVPTNEIASLKAEYPDEFVVAGQIGTYYTIFNVNVSLLPADSTLTGEEAEAANAEIRRAIGLMFDRNYIVDEITQGGQVPASSFVAMGMTDAFDKEKADFSGMSSVADETALRIGRVLHKTFLRVNETGTEAAAATAVEMIAETTALPREKKTVRVDRPFVCGIYDRETQSFLFLGAIYDV